MNLKIHLEMTATTKKIQDFLQSKLHCMSPNFKYTYGNNSFSILQSERHLRN